MRCGEVRRGDLILEKKRKERSRERMLVDKRRGEDR